MYGGEETGEGEGSTVGGYCTTEDYRNPEGGVSKGKCYKKKWGAGGGIMPLPEAGLHGDSGEFLLCNCLLANTSAAAQSILLSPFRPPGGCPHPPSCTLPLTIRSPIKCRF